jgi:CheY-like chemotaxis protein
MGFGRAEVTEIVTPQSTARRPGPRPRRADILLIEDNPADVRLMRESLGGEGAVHLHVVTTAEAALSFVRRSGPYVEAPIPDLVLLDLNLNGMSGLDLLQEIKGDREICHLPVVVFTGSDSEADVAAAYARRANCYVAKPFDPARYQRVLELIREFWLGMAELPPSIAPASR